MTIKEIKEGMTALEVSEALMYNFSELESSKAEKSELNKVSANVSEYASKTETIEDTLLNQKDITDNVVGKQQGRIDSTTGEVISKQGYHYKVEIPKGEFDLMYAFITDYQVGGEKNTGYAFYDESGNYISGGFNSRRAMATIDVPSNAVLFKNTALTSPTYTCILRKKDSLVYRVEKLESDIKSIDNVPDAVVASVGLDGLRLVKNSLTDGEELVAENFPFCNKVGNQYAFSCKVENLGSLIIAQGFNNYRGVHFEISNSNVKSYYDGAVKDNITHGLVIKDFLKVSIQHEEDGSFAVDMMTNGNSFSFVPSFSTFDANGMLKVISNGSSLNMVKLSATNKRFRCPVWVFGASFEGVASSRWVGQCKSIGYFNFLVNGLAGRDSSSIVQDFKKALSFGVPKYLYFAAWGNGSASMLDESINEVLDICSDKKITLIISKRPNSSASDVQETYTQRKAVIDKYISLGCRYVDIAEAVSGNADIPDGWYQGFLSDDGKHPTEIGAKAIAMQVLTDFPEIMQY